jgi:sulfonate transport system substrate-binding protein
MRFRFAQLGLTLLLLASASASACAPAPAPTPAPAAPAANKDAPKLAELNLDFAYYSPTSLVLKRMGWVEEAFKSQNTTVKWVLSAGSNKAIEYLSGNALDFGSTAGAAALLAKTNDVPIKAVYIYEQPEWAALVVGKESTLKDPKELKGKKIAATKGTDPYFFLLRTLNANGLSQADVEVVNLQHDQGRLALERGQVDAWAGLDPHMAASELEAGSKLIYRNKDFNTYGFLNAREAFLAQNPDATKKVIELYERARKWTIEHPDDAVKILSEESQVSLDVAKRELNERMNLKASAVPGEEHVAALKAVIPIMKSEKLVKDGSDPDKALAELIEPSFARAVVGP